MRGTSTEAHQLPTFPHCYFTLSDQTENTAVLSTALKDCLSFGDGGYFGHRTITEFFLAVRAVLGIYSLVSISHALSTCSLTCSFVAVKHHFTSSISIERPVTMSPSAHGLGCESGASNNRSAVASTSRHNDTPIGNPSCFLLLTLPAEKRKRGRPMPHSLATQLSTVQRLAATCRVIRNEVLYEYFKQAQAYLRWDVFLNWKNGWRTTNDKIYIVRSPLVRSYLQHVSLNWTDLLFWTRGPNCGAYSQLSPMEAFMWLQGLPQLRTVELVISEPRHNACPWYEEQSGRFPYTIGSLNTLLESLGRVEKVTVKYELKPETHARWQSDPNFQDLIRFIDGISTSLKGKRPRRPQAIAVHLGCYRPEWQHLKSGEV
ncbi:hypothetical protein B0T20DRAFT_213042 [Sordaria brevicollis]|uniref:Uncharacterized protein n=1 Tax=Sordaria brevicollis TaxID=83679 RepID=A0AAE0PEP8_SORBR|nr:hypothetical protein B0T20DRAFT_213042 [Sordaria brevicollis]